MPNARAGNNVMAFCMYQRPRHAAKGSAGATRYHMRYCQDVLVLLCACEKTPAVQCCVLWHVNAVLKVAKKFRMVLAACAARRKTHASQKEMKNIQKEKQEKNRSRRRRRRRMEAHSCTKYGCKFKHRFSTELSASNAELFKKLFDHTRAHYFDDACHVV